MNKGKISLQRRSSDARPMLIKTKLLLISGAVLILAAAVLTGYNLWADVSAAEASDDVLSELAAALPNTDDKEPVPTYVRNPNIPMPTVNIDGTDYIGALSIPSLGIELPIASDWNYTQLRVSPCRYTGSAYLDDLVICGHNYSSHFGGLKNLKPGDRVVFTDADGNVFEYKVVSVEDLRPTAVEEMKTGDWDLSLFTCTIGGRTRVTVRCMSTDAITMGYK